MLKQTLLPSFLQALAAVIIYHERHVGIHSSGIMFLFWMAMVLYGAFKLLLASIVAHESVRIASLSCPFSFSYPFISSLTVTAYIFPGADTGIFGKGGLG